MAAGDDPHAARRRDLVAAGQVLIDRAERERRGFSVFERQRADAILAELEGLGARGPVQVQRCPVCSRLAPPQWLPCSCGAVGWGHRGLVAP